MKEIRYYEAFDGTLFSTAEKCTEYEKNSREKIKEDFKKLIVRQAEGIQITQEGSAFPLAEIAECWWYGVIVMKDDNDYETVKRFARKYDKDIPKMLNKEIFVGLGEGNSNTCDYDCFYWWGTVEDAIENYKKTIMTFNVKGE